MLIAFAGVRGAGKDTAASVVLARPGYAHIKMADGLKGMLRSLLAYQGVAAEEIERRVEGDLKEQPCEALAGRSARHAMVALGTEWGRELIAPDFWVRVAEARCRLFDDVVISDIRFPNEVEMVRRLGGKVYRIVRPGMPVVDHVSESQIAGLAVDVEIVNDAPSAEAFRARVAELVP